MAQLNVYDSEGIEYGEDSRQGRQNEEIRQFFFAGVMVAVDLTTSPTVTGFFRARETDSGRSEQFYGRFRANSSTNLLGNFKSSVERWADRNDMSLVTDMEDASLFRKLSETPGDPPGSEFDHLVVGALVNRGESARVGVGSDDDALALLQMAVADYNTGKVAITSDSEGNTLDDFDLVISRGRYRGIEFLGETKTKVQQAQPEIEDQLVAATIDDIQSKVRDLKQRTSMGDAELERRFRQRISIFSSPDPRGSRQGQGPSQFNRRSQSTTNNQGISVGSLKITKGSIKIVSVIVLIALILLASAYVAMFLGFIPGDAPVMDGQNSQGDNSGDGPETSTHYVNGSYKEGSYVEGSSPFEENITVKGKTNGENVTIYLNSSGENIDEKTVEVDDDKKFSATMDIKGVNGSANLTVIARFEDGGETTKETEIKIHSNNTDGQTTQSKPELNLQSPVKNESVSASVWVNGTTNVSTVEVTIMQDGEEIQANDSVTVSDGKFENSYDLNKSGTDKGEVTITVSASNGSVENNESVTITFEPGPRTENNSPLISRWGDAQGQTAEAHSQTATQVHVSRVLSGEARLR